ncbi:hypothetical protein EVAR_57794_1 [Eumeta japonica]|uniref:Uncharacterized protein n=1 Tax=Eumeta variegata TaxID=151549 RepID=A0A4C1Y548_EUMVA|nr:hypothetical protein EVAR_57794_1 [Eumeta japonica]
MKNEQEKIEHKDPASGDDDDESYGYLRYGRAERRLHHRDTGELVPRSGTKIKAVEKSVRSMRCTDCQHKYKNMPARSPARRHEAANEPVRTITSNTR